MQDAGVPCMHGAYKCAQGIGASTILRASLTLGRAQLSMPNPDPTPHIIPVLYRKYSFGLATIVGYANEGIVYLRQTNKGIVYLKLLHHTMQSSINPIHKTDPNPFNPT